MALHRWPLIVFYTICALLLIVGPTTAASTLPPTTQPAVADDDPIELPNDEITPEQEQAMWAEIHKNVELLRGMGRLAAPNPAQIVALGMPLRMAPGLSDYAGFRVSAFADHNPASGQVLDYNGGTRTYDGHRGTDYALYPFNWNKVDAGEVQVIAAAAGTIVSKANVDPTDHNCITSSNDPWNYVALVHADGRMTIYGHMRYNSITSKNIGQTVAQGEFLGTVASSGNSSGPHVHFEVRTGSFSITEWVDPYAGQASQPISLWSGQRPYFDSAINKVSTHSAPPSSPDPCQPTTTNIQGHFTTPRNIYFYTFYRDYQAAIPTQLSIYRPDGSVFQTSQYAPGNSAFYSSWSNGWAVNFPADVPPGTWRFEAIYNGQITQTFFDVNVPVSVPPNYTHRVYLPIIQPHS